ncbi:hypothetical protein UY3_09856 [Chelonia mydas]|uniref:Uncharacterized protein n=1 Tax=Chelonia mydas TaxID=8469 RepID=M7BBR7_CHEMY|nr:hypothetical protein UY3_09856 [Chelonia mydas]
MAGVAGNTEAGFGGEEDDDEDVVDSSQQGSGETGFPNSQDLFLTLDLEPVPPDSPKAGSQALKVEKGPLVIVLHILLDNAHSVYSAHNCRGDLSGLHVPSAMASVLKKEDSAVWLLAIIVSGCSLEDSAVGLPSGLNCHEMKLKRRLAQWGPGPWLGLLDATVMQIITTYWSSLGKVKFGCFSRNSNYNSAVSYIRATVLKSVVVTEIALDADPDCFFIVLKIQEFGSVFTYANCLYFDTVSTRSALNAVACGGYGGKGHDVVFLFFYNDLTFKSIPYPHTNLKLHYIVEEIPSLLCADCKTFLSTAGNGPP